MRKRKATILDMDGTLCDVRPIRHLVRGPDRNFHAFHMASIDCLPNPGVVALAHRAKAEDRDVLIVTARKWKYRNVTAMWLALHEVPSDAMFMRRDDDSREDFLVKRDILRQIRTRWNPVEAADDNPSIIKLWKSEKILTHVVPGWGEVA